MTSSPFSPKSMLPLMRDLKGMTTEYLSIHIGFSSQSLTHCIASVQTLTHSGSPSQRLHIMALLSSGWRIGTFLSKPDACAAAYTLLSIQSPLWSGIC
jgi:hypothetical protein